MNVTFRGHVPTQARKPVVFRGIQSHVALRQALANYLGLSGEPSPEQLRAAFFKADLKNYGTMLLRYKTAGYDAMMSYAQQNQQALHAALDPVLRNSGRTMTVDEFVPEAKAILSPVLGFASTSEMEQAYAREIARAIEGMNDQSPAAVAAKLEAASPEDIRRWFGLPQA